MDFVSSIKKIDSSIDKVYNKLSDLRNVPIIEKDIPKFGKVTTEVIDSDHCAVNVPMLGNIPFQIINRSECKEVKLESDGGSVGATIWLQLLPISEGSETKIRLTLRMGIPSLFASKVKKQLTEGIDKLAEALTHINYDA